MIKYYKSVFAKDFEDRLLLCKVELKYYKTGFCAGWDHYEYMHNLKHWMVMGNYDSILYKTNLWKEIPESEVFLELL